MWLTCRIGDGKPRRAIDLWCQVLPPIRELLLRHPLAARMLVRHKGYFWLVLAVSMLGGMLLGLGGGILYFTRLHGMPELSFGFKADAESLWTMLLMVGLLLVGLSGLFSYDCFRHFLMMMDTYNNRKEESTFSA